jgi:hypothetical protein
MRVQLSGNPARASFGGKQTVFMNQHDLLSALSQEMRCDLTATWL